MGNFAFVLIWLLVVSLALYYMPKRQDQRMIALKAELIQCELQRDKEEGLVKELLLFQPFIEGCWRRTRLYRRDWGFDCEDCKNTYPFKWGNWSKPALICDYLSLGGCCPYRHLFGHEFKRGPQLGLGDLLMLDFALSAHPNLVNITEFGTLGGFTSLWLGIISAFRGGIFHSFDIGENRNQRTRFIWLPNMVWFKDNILIEDVGTPNAVESVSRHSFFGFFDNGRKSSEMNTYLKFVQEIGSVVCTHDWTTELAPESIQTKVKQAGFVAWAHEFGELVGSHVRCFKKIQKGELY